MLREPEEAVLTQPRGATRGAAEGAPRDELGAMIYGSAGWSRVVMKWAVFCIADTNKVCKAGNSFKLHE